jgi:hypothetical protein
MSARLPAVSRRQLLVGGGAALAGAVLLGACGGDDDQGGGETTSPSEPGGLALVQYFGGLPMLAAGSDIRAPFGVADAEGPLSIDSSPETISIDLLAPDGSPVAEGIEVARYAEGLERPYYPLRFRVDEPGIYTGRTELEGEALEMAIKVDPVTEITTIQVGAAMPAIVTPTPADPRAVDPICTNDPPCPLHDRTLEAAMAEGAPVAFLIATPAFCQTAICGPVLDVLRSQVDAHPDIRFLHAEVYAHPEENLDSQTPAVTELGLTFEPCLVLVGADGAVAERLDIIFDGVEVADALGRLTAAS